MEDLINRVNNSDTKIEPGTFPEASFQDIVKEAHYYTGIRPFDLIFLCAGIFDIVQKSNTSRMTSIFHGSLVKA